MLSFPELEIKLHECWILWDRTDANLTHLEYDTLAYLASIKLVKIISRLYNIFLKEVIILKIREEYTCPLELMHYVIKGKYYLKANGMEDILNKKGVVPRLTPTQK